MLDIDTLKKSLGEMPTPLWREIWDIYLGLEKGEITLKYESEAQKLDFPVDGIQEMGPFKAVSIYKVVKFLEEKASSGDDYEKIIIALHKIWVGSQNRIEFDAQYLDLIPIIEDACNIGNREVVRTMLNDLMVIRAARTLKEVMDEKIGTIKNKGNHRDEE